MNFDVNCILTFMISTINKYECGHHTHTTYGCGHNTHIYDIIIIISPLLSLLVSHSLVSDNSVVRSANPLEMDSAKFMCRCLEVQMIQLRHAMGMEIVF